MEPTDQDLIAQCQQGNRNAFEPLFRRYRDQAHGFALGLVGSPDQALDLTQEAFIRAYQALNRFRPGAAFEPWFFRIWRNLCLNAIRTWAFVGRHECNELRGVQREANGIPRR